MTESIHQILEALPSSSLTTHLLGALDYLVPGEWQNITTYEGMIKSATGEEDADLIQRVGERGIALWFDEGQGYQRAVQVYRAVDSLGTAAGVAAFANKLGERVELLSFLTDITPKPDTTQAVDAGVKFAAELAAFCLTNGIPGDSVADFVSAVASYGKEESMRLAAWLAFDCIIPLGPDFLSKAIDGVEKIAESDLANHRVFRFVSEHLPGSLEDKRQLVKRTLQESSTKIDELVQGRGMTREGLLDRVKGYLDVSDDKLDYVAAALDVSTNYFEHTGVQTVARRLVSRAYGEI